MDNSGRNEWKNKLDHNQHPKDKKEPKKRRIILEICVSFEN